MDHQAGPSENRYWKIIGITVLCVFLACHVAEIVLLSSSSQQGLKIVGHCKCPTVSPCDCTIRIVTNGGSALHREYHKNVSGPSKASELANEEPTMISTRKTIKLKEESSQSVTNRVGEIAHSTRTET